MVQVPSSKTGGRNARAAEKEGSHQNLRDTQFKNRCQRFVDVAEELFLEHGFAGTSVNEVVRRAGGSLATLYAEFRTKDELFEAVMNRRAAKMFTNILVGASDAVGIKDELEKVARQLLGYMLSESALAVYRLAVHDGPKFPAVRNAVLVTGLQGFLRQLGEYFAGLVKAGKLEINDTAVAAELFLTLIQGQMRTIAACGDVGRISDADCNAHVKFAVFVFLKVYPPQAR